MSVNNCIFCKIAGGLDPNTNLLYQDENFVVFPDIRPAAQHHYLVVPKLHIPNINYLTEENVDLVNSLVDIGNKVLKDKSGNENDVRLGFHRPPFLSVGHLHLHVISPASSMSFFGRTIFRSDSWWFTTVQTLLLALKKGKL